MRFSKINKKKMREGQEEDEEEEEEIIGRAGESLRNLTALAVFDHKSTS